MQRFPLLYQQSLPKLPRFSFSSPIPTIKELVSHTHSPKLNKITQARQAYVYPLFSLNIYERYVIRLTLNKNLTINFWFDIRFLWLINKTRRKKNWLYKLHKQITEQNLNIRGGISVFIKRKMNLLKQHLDVFFL